MRTSPPAAPLLTKLLLTHISIIAYLGGISPPPPSILGKLRFDDLGLSSHETKMHVKAKTIGI